jgi:hypothetical protein
MELFDFCEAIDGQTEIRYRVRVMRWTELPPVTRTD